MNGERVLLDSVIIIDHFNGIEEATRFLLQPLDMAITAVTRAEVLTGFAEKKRKLPKQLLDSFETIPLGKEAADLAAVLRRKLNWKLPDAFQAACAILSERLLVTRNTKDFRPTRDRFVRVPYTI
jgi:predicted nucleic acid-binding protein